MMKLIEFVSYWVKFIYTQLWWREKAHVREQEYLHPNNKYEVEADTQNWEHNNNWDNRMKWLIWMSVYYVTQTKT